MELKDIAKKYGLKGNLIHVKTFIPNKDVIKTFINKYKIKQL